MHSLKFLGEKKDAMTPIPENYLHCSICDRFRHPDDFSSKQKKPENDLNRYCLRHSSTSCFNQSYRRPPPLPAHLIHDTSSDSSSNVVVADDDVDDDDDNDNDDDKEENAEDIVISPVSVGKRLTKNSPRKMTTANRKHSAESNLTSANNRSLDEDLVDTEEEDVPESYLYCSQCEEYFPPDRFTPNQREILKRRCIRHFAEIK